MAARADIIGDVGESNPAHWEPPFGTGNLPPIPQPEVLGRNGTYLAVRKLHTKVAAWRQYLRANSSNPEEEALLGAKMIGRCPSGAPLTLSPRA
jgi:deferrochelatase/peroxidase EfeB